MNILAQEQFASQPYSISPEEAFEKFGSMVYRLAFVRTKNRSDADDVLQDVFMRLLRYQKGFDSEEHLKAWLLRVTVNRSNTLLTCAHRKRNVPLDENLSTSMKDETPVLAAVASLPIKYRTVIHLFYFEDYSLHEISHILNIKEGTLRSQLFRARDLLRDKLKGEID